MLEFREISITDKAWIKTALSESNYMTCEYSFPNNFAWRRLLNYRVCRYDNFYITGDIGENPSFLFPAGSGDIRSAIEEMRLYSENKNSPLKILSLNAEKLELMKNLYKDSFFVETLPEFSDYILDSAEAANPTGHLGKRCRRFEREFGERAVFKKITNYDDYEKCIIFAAMQYNEKSGYLDKTALDEQFAIHEYFMNYNELEIEGLMLFIDDVLCGFTIGSQLNSDTFDVNIEKADKNVSENIFAYIARGMARLVEGRYKYINIEEDLGVSGLRYAKQLSHPVMLLPKYDIAFK